MSGSHPSVRAGVKVEEAGTGAASPQTVRVLMVDDQPQMADAVREMFALERDVEFRYCRNPKEALDEALRFSPTVILQDLVMPQMEGLTLTRLFKAHPFLKEVPLVVLSSREQAGMKADAFTNGADDYLVKVPEKVELLARVRYHSCSYLNLVEKKKAFEALEASREALEREVRRAAGYVRSLLPPPLPEGPVRAEWHFHPCSTLGGDSLGYHWIDGDHFAVYLIDASGHGVGSALLSVSALNMIRAQTLPGTDFLDPGAVLSSLNEAFPMRSHDNLYFTIWYGVFEICGPDGTFWSYGELEEHLREKMPPSGSLDSLYRHVIGIHGDSVLDDDFSVLRLTFLDHSSGEVDAPGLPGV